MCAVPKSKKLVLHLLLALSIVGCAPSLPSKDLQDVPIKVRPTDSDAIDVDLVYEAARKAAIETLPEAYFRAMSYRATCNSLANLSGTLNFGFIQVNRLVFKEILVIDAVIDLSQETMDIYYVDADDKYTATSQRIYAGNSYIQAVLDLASEELKHRGATDCTVDVTQLDSAWHVFYYDKCEAPAGQCEFVIQDDEVKSLLESRSP